MANNKSFWLDSPVLAVTQTQDISCHSAKSRWFGSLFRSLSNQFGIRFHVVVNDIDNREIMSEKISVVKLSEGRPNFTDLPLFYAKLLKHSSSFLRKNKNSLIHSVVLVSEGLESISLLALSGQTSGHPFLIGPAEAGHPFVEDDFIKYTTTPKLAKIQYNGMKGIRKVLAPALKAGFLKTLDDCDIMIAVNETTKRIYSKSVSSKKIKVIPYGIDSNEFEYSEVPMAHTVLSVGSLISRKNFPCLIRAMAKVRKEYPDASLQIVGSGPEESALRHEAIAAGFPLAIRGKITQEELLASYRACRVFCQPSLAESFSHTILEAMAHGRPVVSTKTVGSEMVENGTGFLVPLNNSDAIADRILRLFSDDELARRMAREGRKLAEEKYSWPKVARQYRQIYEEIGAKNR